MLRHEEGEEVHVSFYLCLDLFGVDAVGGEIGLYCVG